MDSELSHEGETEIMLGQKSAFPETSESLGFLASPFLSLQGSKTFCKMVWVYCQVSIHG